MLVTFLVHCFLVPIPPIEMIQRRNVTIGVHVFDNLIQSCRENLDQFVTSFFDVVTQLLDSKNYDLQIMGTNSV